MPEFALVRMAHPTTRYPVGRAVRTIGSGAIHA
ncbi:hypothetical protein SAMN05216601_101526 [Ectopseudomonas composti]|jgi:hypothetical protein|uniref:Uncharacterized protein n=1 Tax=Ectopseudomonas composti TaxID=658457 RepID=A0A1I5JKU6_9GAMM|nr:hypothetical protein SAMN05216601_101526 [Pseudomonas composti]